MKRRKPERGAFLPNEHFYYNNWDFNVLPMILERATGKKLGTLIYEWLAIPLGMKDFVPSNVTYEYANITEHPQTRVYISAEDLARFSALYLTDGRWYNNQIIPAKWIYESTQKVSYEPVDADLVEHPFMEGYAYLWWIDEDQQTIWADGAGGHFCIIDRKNNLAVILRNNTGMSAGSLFFYNADNPYEGNEGGDEVFQFIKSKL
jgi:CubicO group peptidase (beta-lactamase class C family)